MATYLRPLDGPFAALVALAATDDPRAVRVTASWCRNGQQKAVAAVVPRECGGDLARYWLRRLRVGEEPPA